MHPCQTDKSQRHINAPVQNFDLTDRRFDHTHVDIVGPLPSSRGISHFFTIVDCASALTAHWIARFSIPAVIFSDRGAQFTSDLWSAMTQLLCTKLQSTTAYHPQANGLVERIYRYMKSSPKAELKDSDWIDELTWVLLDIRTTQKEDLATSSAKLVYGAPLCTILGDFTPAAQG